jgi:hypothetical protein
MGGGVMRGANEKTATNMVRSHLSEQNDEPLIAIRRVPTKILTDG